MKELVKWIISPLISDALGVNPNLHSHFFIHIDYSHPKDTEIVNPKYFITLL